MDIDLNIKTNNMNKLVFNGLEYELIEVPPWPRFKIYGKEYKDIGDMDDNAIRNLEFQFDKSISLMLE